VLSYARSKSNRYIIIFLNEKFIQEAIESVFAQTYEPELLLWMMAQT